MSGVISIQEVRRRRAAAQSDLPERIGARAGAAASGASGQLSIVKEEVHRSILLLGLAAQLSHFLVREVSDPPRRTNLEAQIKTIERQLHVARQMASNI